MKLADQTAIVTGGTSGIGRSIATELAAEGAAVAIGDIRETPRGSTEQPTAATIRDDGGEAIFAETDVTNDEDAERLVDRTVESFGGVDVLVNNAGILLEGRVDEMTQEEWDRTFAVNVRSIYHCTRHALPHLRESDAPRIVNLSSQIGLVGNPADSAYCASKGAVANLTRQMAVDYADDRITVNAINPGVVRTEMSAEQLEDEEVMAEVERKTLLPFVGKPRDIGRAAVFLASRDARFVTGHCLVVDGGWTAH